MIHRRAAKRDENEGEIIKALRTAGASVAQVSGKGVPDLLVGFRGKTFLMEVKMPGRWLTQAQEEFRDAWAGATIYIVETREEALGALGLTVSMTRPREMATVENDLLSAPRKTRQKGR